MDCAMRPSPQRHTLAVLRTLIGFTQKQMANIAECSVPTIQAVELCKLKLSADLADRIHFQTGICTEWLLANDVSKPPVSSRGDPYTKESFEERQASLASPKKTTVGSYSDLWRTWEMFIKHVKLLAILYTDAYSRGKVPIAFYKSLMATKEIFEKTIGHTEYTETRLAKLSYSELGPVDLFELTETIEEFEADTYNVLKFKLKETKEKVPPFIRDYFRKYEKNLVNRSRKRNATKFKPSILAVRKESA